MSGKRRSGSGSSELTCPSCKVTINSRNGRRRESSSIPNQVCPYCGCYYDPNSLNVVSSGYRRNSSAGALPTLKDSSSPSAHRSRWHNGSGHHNTRSNWLSYSTYTRVPAPDESAIGNLLMTNLGRVTLGTLGISPYLDPGGRLTRLPQLVDSKNKLVQLGSGNSTPDLTKTVSPSGSSLSKTPSILPEYPERKYDRSSFTKMLSQAKKSKDFSAVQDFYISTFCSPASICATFKKDPKQNGASIDKPDLESSFINSVHDKVEQTPATVQKSMLKSIVGCLLTDQPDACHANSSSEQGEALYEKDYARALFILVQNPIFSSQSTYTILAHLLQHVTSLPNGDHQLLVHWFRTLDTKRFRAILRTLLQFVTIRQFPPLDKSLPPLSKSRWWIPTATKVLALLNASNNLCYPHIVEYSEFYNETLDHMDLMQEYYAWQNPDRPGIFSYCQYPFVISIVGKRHILTKDSEQQMILTARRSLVQKMARHQQPQIEIFFLNISVRRSHIVTDSLKEISQKQKDLKKKLKVSFIGEPGLDMGGLTKEWFQLLIRKIFDPDYGMFVYHDHSRCYWFSVAEHTDDNEVTENVNNGRNKKPSNLLKEYNLVGVLMGLAVYNSIILDLHLPSICYRKLLSPPVVPPVEGKDDTNEPTSYKNVGIVSNPTLEDLSEIMPDVAHSLRDVLEYKGNVEEDLMLTFQVSLEEYGRVYTTDLSKSIDKNHNNNDMAKILLKSGKIQKDPDHDPDPLPVTNENRDEFVRLYLEWLLNNRIAERFRAFYLGFHSVCASNALIMLRPEEVEQLVCGCPTLDLNELRKVTVYDGGFKKDDQTIVDFWQILEDYSIDLQKKFLLFTTGSDRVPVGGMGEMTFKITRLKEKLENLPEAHTCFNQLVLPDYRNKEVLKRKLTIAISNAEGFGLE